MKPSSVFAVILCAATTASCASASANVHVATPLRPPVGARLVSQPAQPQDHALQMDLSAYLVSEPAMIDVRMRVTPDDRARSLTVNWWTPDGVGGSHLISLDGDHSPARFDYPIKRMTEGQYTVTAVLRRNDGSEAWSTRRVFVVGKDTIPNVAPGIAESETGPVVVVSAGSRPRWADRSRPSR